MTQGTGKTLETQIGPIEQLTNRQISKIFDHLGSKRKNPLDTITNGEGVYEQWLQNPEVRMHPRDNNAGPEYFERFGFGDRTKRSYLQRQFKAGEERLLRLAQMSQTELQEHYRRETSGADRPAVLSHRVHFPGYKSVRE